MLQHAKNMKWHNHYIYRISVSTPIPPFNVGKCESVLWTLHRGGEGKMCIEWFFFQPLWQSAVCISPSLCILPLVYSLQSSVFILRWLQVIAGVMPWNYFSVKRYQHIFLSAAFMSSRGRGKGVIEAAIFLVISHYKKLIRTNFSKCQTEYRLTKWAI